MQLKWWLLELFLQVVQKPDGSMISLEHVVPCLFQEPNSRAWFLMMTESNEIAAFLGNALLKKKKIWC
jgi:hypothetical protein